MSQVDLEAKIPNNVGLRDNQRLLRALDAWPPTFLDWLRELAPSDCSADHIYRLTPIRLGNGGCSYGPLPNGAKACSTCWLA